MLALEMENILDRRLDSTESLLLVAYAQESDNIRYFTKLYCVCLIAQDVKLPSHLQDFVTNELMDDKPRKVRPISKNWFRDFLISSWIAERQNLGFSINLLEAVVKRAFDRLGRPLGTVPNHLRRSESKQAFKQDFERARAIHDEASERLKALRAFENYCKKTSPPTVV